MEVLAGRVVENTTHLFHLMNIKCLARVLLVLGGYGGGQDRHGFGRMAGRIRLLYH